MTKKITLPQQLNCLQEFPTSSKKNGLFYSLPWLVENGMQNILNLPICLRIFLESLIRHYDGYIVTDEHIKYLINWSPDNKQSGEIPFFVSRIILQDYTGIPLLADLAAMRNVLQKLGKNPAAVEPSIPVSLVIDHSLQTDFVHHPNALHFNMEHEFKRNQERYKFLKWGANAFKSLEILPPGLGIVHQINLEYLAKGILEKNNIYFADSVIGTDSHTTMINGLGIVGWGVGGIEAEVAMLGHPIHITVPDVIGIHLYGHLREGISTTDLVLTITEILRKTNVVGKFIEFFGAGAQSLSVPERATIANMAPEYGATMSYFPPDQKSAEYLLATGRDPEQVEIFINYFKAQKMFGISSVQQHFYNKVIEINLNFVEPSIAGPKRPQDRINLNQLKEKFNALIFKPSAEGGYEKHFTENYSNISAENLASKEEKLQDGDILIAAITSCTNTSNPSVLLAAGLLAKKAVAKGLIIKPYIKTSFTPGSRAVTEYLATAGLKTSFEQLGFNIVGYACATCAGNVGELDEKIEATLVKNNLIGVAVLSGNRNFEARIHPKIKANFLMSPALVIAFAIAGRINIDMENEPLGYDKNSDPVFLKHIWPSHQEITELLPLAYDSGIYHQMYANFKEGNPLWNSLPIPTSVLYEWDKNSTYILQPPFFDSFSLTPKIISDIYKARALLILGDSITTDHISPVSTIKTDSPAGQYLLEKNVKPKDFNNYGTRRGNHEVMLRGTFSNIRLKNLMLQNGEEGGITIHYPSKRKLSIYDAAMEYLDENRSLLIFAGENYGMGSSRDWAAKGTKLLGVKAVIACSFERIHRSNLIGMGVLPCQFKNEYNVKKLSLTGEEEFDLVGISSDLTINKEITLVIWRDRNLVNEIPLTLCLENETELTYIKHNGMLPFMLRYLADNSDNY